MNKVAFGSKSLGNAYVPGKLLTIVKGQCEPLIEHSIEQSSMELEQFKGEWRRAIMERIVENTKTLNSIEEELIKAEERNRLCKIASPIDGIVQGLEMHTLGYSTPLEPYVSKLRAMCLQNREPAFSA